MLTVWGLYIKGLQSYQLSKLEVSRKSLPLRPFHPYCVQSHSARVRFRARSNHFQSLTASNFEALWPIDLKFLAFKDLFSFSIVSKVQEAGSILKVVFALSKWPHLHRAYLVTVCNQNFIAVYLSYEMTLNWNPTNSKFGKNHQKCEFWWNSRVQTVELQSVRPKRYHCTIFTPEPRRKNHLFMNVTYIFVKRI